MIYCTTNTKVEDDSFDNFKLNIFTYNFHLDEDIYNLYCKDNLDIVCIILAFHFKF